MFIGEAPGADEDRVGKPFMGRSGKLLDRMMAAIGLDRTSAYVANIVPWRPPGNRNPTPQEVAICKPFIERQIELADPDLIVCLGSPATQAITGTKDGILKARGPVLPLPGRGPRDPRPGDPASGLPAAPAPAEAPRLAGLPDPARAPSTARPEPARGCAQAEPYAAPATYFTRPCAGPRVRNRV